MLVLYLQGYVLTHSQPHILTDIDVVVLIGLKTSNGAEMVLPLKLEVHEPAHDLLFVARKQHLMPRHGSHLSHF